LCFSLGIVFPVVLWIKNILVTPMHVSRWLFAIAGALCLTPTTLAPAKAQILFPTDDYNYNECTSELRALDLPENTIASACAHVLHPEELSACVTELDTQTNVATNDALAACQQVRRPEEMASCVVDVTAQFTAANATKAMDYCRRSLLPDRFAQCVVGIGEELSNVTATNAMETCIDGRDRPRNFYPANNSEGETPTESSPNMTPEPAPGSTPNESEGETPTEPSPNMTPTDNSESEAQTE
jgi:hypothetical protein